MPWCAILLEGRGILCEAVHCARLSRHTFHQHSDCHPTRERVRVNDHVRLHPALRKRHIHRRPLLRTDTLLAVPRRELVTYHRRTRNAQRDVDFLQFRIAGIASCQRNY